MVVQPMPDSGWRGVGVDPSTLIRRDRSMDLRCSTTRPFSDSAGRIARVQVNKTNGQLPVCSCFSPLQSTCGGSRDLEPFAAPGRHTARDIGKFSGVVREPTTPTP